jgi:tetratricopeptide (TPR) repeat protein
MQTTSRANPDMHLRKALQHLRAGRDAQAEAILLPLADAHPHRADIAQTMGMIMGSKGRDAEAAQWFARAHRIDPGNFDVAFNLGRALLMQAQHAQAEATLTHAAGLRPSVADSWELIAVAQSHQGKTEAALASLDQAIAVAPQRAQPHQLKAKLLAAAHQLDAAVHAIGQAVHLDPNNATLRMDQGRIHAHAGERETAIKCFTAAVNLAPDIAIGWAELGATMAHMGVIEGPLSCFSRALKLAPQDPTILLKCGRAMLNMGQLAVADRALSSAAKLRPNDVEVLANLAGLRERQGRHEEARDLAQGLLDGADTNTNVALVFARASTRLKDPAAAIELLSQVMTSPRLDPERSLLQHELGQAHDKAGHHEAAIAAHTQANDLCHLTYDEAEREAIVAETMAVHSAEKIAARPKAQATTDLPVLIVGMPRSGTSLVEQIIAAHPLAFGAGELEELRYAEGMLIDLTGEPGVADALGAMTQAHAETLGAWYQERLRNHAQAAGEDLASIRRITDKMPPNFQLLGLAAHIVPGARIIHCVRDPIDTCLSCFFQAFGDGYGFATRLEWLGHYHRQYQRLMDHWRTNLSCEILEVRYEDVVANAEEMSRKIIAHCGLEWDPAVLNFHTAKRVCKTASYDQVRRPIYTSSVKRSEAYRPWLGSLIEALGDEPGLR